MSNEAAGMRFRELINGLEQTCIEMHQAARLEQWDDVAALDRRRAHLLADMGSVDEHLLTDTLRQRIDHIMTLDQQILTLIREARSRSERLAAREQSNHGKGASMYAEMIGGGTAPAAR